MKLQKQHDQLIVLDFDHTLFNTTAFLDALKDRFNSTFDISIQDFEAAYKKARSEWKPVPTYMPHDDIQAVRQEMLAVAGSCGEAALYPEVKSFLERHGRQFDIFILTRGHEDLQTAKIEGTGVHLPYAVVQGGKVAAFAQLVANYTTIHFIDDAPENIDEVKAVYPQVVTYHLKRAGDDTYHYKREDSQLADKTVENLDFTIPSRQ